MTESPDSRRLQRHCSTSGDAEVDVIYDATDRLMREGRFDTLNMVLKHWRRDDHPDFLLAILTATLPAKSKLPNREALLSAARLVLRDSELAGL